MNPIYLEVLVVALGIVLLMVEAFVASADKRYVAYLGIAGLAAIFVASFWTNPLLIPSSAPYSAFYSADVWAMFFKRFSLLATILVLVMSIDYVPVIERFVPSAGKGGGVGEFFALPVLTCAGLMWMVSAIDFISIFVSLELVTISFYVLVAYLRRSHATPRGRNEIPHSGSPLDRVHRLRHHVDLRHHERDESRRDRRHPADPGACATERAAIWIWPGFGGPGIQDRRLPFQFWVPDVYQGSPTPVTAFLSVASKAAGFVVLYRVVFPFFGEGCPPVLHDKMVLILSLIAGATLLYGNLAALPQTNFKRLLSYSSVGHAGYLLMAVASLDVGLAQPAIVFYLAALPADDVPRVHGYGLGFALGGRR